MNFHPAPLPDYRGLGGYNIAILDNAASYGVTAHIMTSEFDAGEIIKVSRFQIDPFETAYSLEQKSMRVMLRLFKAVFSAHFDDYIKEAYINDMSKGVYISKAMFEEMKFIPSGAPQSEINRRIRAFWYPPYEGAKIKIGNHYYTVVNSDVLSSIKVSSDRGSEYE